MKAVIAIALHHLKRTAKNPGLILLLLAIPVSIATIEYAAFGGTAASGKLPPIKVLFLDEDDSFVSRGVPQVFTGGPLADMFEIAPAADLQEAERQFRRNQASALVRIPKGFQAGVLSGDGASVDLYKNPTQTFSPDIVDSVLEMGTVLANGLYAEAREPIARIQALTDADAEPSTADVASIAVGFYLAGKRMGKLEGLQDMSVDVKRAGGAKSEGPSRGPKPGEFFAVVFPGLTLFSLMFISQALAVRLLRDRMRGLQRRLLLTPTSPGAIVAGGVAYLIAAMLVLLVVLAIIGSFIFRITLREPAALLLLGVGFAVFTSGLQLAIAASAKNDQIAQTISGIVIIVLSLAGGTFVNPELLPSFLRTIADVVPNGAAQQGLVDVLSHGKSLPAIIGAAGTVWLWAAAVLGWAIFAERRGLAR